MSTVVLDSEVPARGRRGQRLLPFSGIASGAVVDAPDAAGDRRDQ